MSKSGKFGLFLFSLIIDNICYIIYISKMSKLNKLSDKINTYKNRQSKIRKAKYHKARECGFSSHEAIILQNWGMESFKEACKEKLKDKKNESQD